MNKIVISALFALSIVGCTHTGTVSTVAPTNIYSGYDSKVEGKSSYMIDATSLTKLKRDDAVKGFMCSAHKFPVDGTEAFVTSVPSMLGAVFEDPTEQVSDPRKNTINFVFRVERFEPRLKFSPKFFSADAEATVDMSLSVAGTYNGKRVFGTTVESQRSASSEAGSFCSGGEVGLHEATASVIKDVLEKIGERISNSNQVRAALASPSPKKKQP